MVMQKYHAQRICHELAFIFSWRLKSTNLCFFVVVLFCFVLFCFVLFLFLFFLTSVE